MDHTDNLYKSINKSADERKALYDLVRKNEAQVNSTQSETHQLMLTQNFLKLEILETVDCYNTFVEFVNSLYIIKSSDDRDSHEILTLLMAQKSKGIDILQKLTYNAEQLEEELAKLNSQKQINVDNKQQLAESINNMKVLLQQIHLKIEDKENLQKHIEEKTLVLREQNEALLCSNEELVEILNQKTIEINNFERDTNYKSTAAKISLTNEYKLKIDAVRTDTLEIEKKWKLERFNSQKQLNELIKVKTNEELNLQKELDALKWEVAHLNDEYTSSANDVQILHQKNNAMDNLAQQLENDCTVLETKLILLDNETTQKKLNHLNLMNKLREDLAEDQLGVAEDLHKTNSVVSSTEVSSSRTARLTDHVDLSDLDG